MSPFLPVTCPQCLQVKGCRMEDVSNIAHVDYYRCADCGHVWTTPKAMQYRPLLDIPVRRPA
jgi:hypothetical protein